jgi:hypothetical protein
MSTLYCSKLTFLVVNNLNCRIIEIVRYITYAYNLALLSNLVFPKSNLTVKLLLID